MTKSLPNLEVLRFSAAAGIVLWHYQHFSFVGHERFDWAYHNLPYFESLRVPFSTGAHAVEFFWLLSGFIFFHQYAAKISTGTTTARDFAVRRFSRLYPLHITTMVLVLVLQALYQRITPTHQAFVYEKNSWRDAVLHFFFASQWSEHRRYSINGPVWSVSMEVLAYITFFLVMRFVPKPLWVIAIAPYVLVWGANKHSMLATMFALFFMGGAVWLFVTHAPRWTSILVAVATVWTAHALGKQFTGHVGFSPRTTAAMYGVFAGVIALAAWLPQANGRLATLFSRLGDLTYASYLIHFPLQLVAVTIAAYFDTRVAWTHPGVLIAYVLGVFLVAHLVFSWFERPAQKWIRAGLLPQ